MTRYVMASTCAAAWAARPAPPACKTPTPPAGVQWRRGARPRDRRVPRRAPQLPADGLHALRRAAVRGGHPPGDAEAPRRPGHHRLRRLHRLRQLRDGLPYEARSIVHKPRFAYGDQPIAWRRRFDPRASRWRPSAASAKAHRRRRGDWHPRRDPGHPACVNSRIRARWSSATSTTPTARSAACSPRPQHFHMHEGSAPGRASTHLGSRLMKPNRPSPPASAPRLQQHWDWARRRQLHPAAAAAAGSSCCRLASLAGRRGASAAPPPASSSSRSGCSASGSRSADRGARSTSSVTSAARG